MTFTAVENTTLTLKQNKIEPHKLLKSTDGVNWTKWENPATNGISLNVGESVYLKADEDAITRTANSDTEYNYFSSTGNIKCDGDTAKIVKNIIPGNYINFSSKLFIDCTLLTQAPELPSTILADNCYSDMFSGCTSLTTAP